MVQKSLNKFILPIKDINFNKDYDLCRAYIGKEIVLLHEKKSNIRGCDVTLKVLDYCNNNEGDVVYLNDDFIIERLPAEPIYNGELKDNPNHNISYRTATVNTLEFLKAHNKPILNFETHTPIIINCKKFRDLFNSLDFGDNNHFLKSIYLNWYEVKGQSGENVKIHQWSTTKAENLFRKYGCLSLADHTPDHAYTWLRNRLEFR